MNRSERVQEIWDWLPAFRAVAELEHLGRAAESLHLSAPALSRTIKLLEQALGHPLFHRRGRGLQLNDEGRLLLAKVRDAMRWVEDGLATLAGREHQGNVRIGALGVAAHVHLPRLINRLVQDLPGLRPVVSTPEVESVRSGLLGGELDLVLTSAAASDAELRVERLADVTNSVYCGPGHPLSSGRQPRTETLLEHSFVAPPPNALGVTDEGWPADLTRRVACEIDRMPAGVEACASGGLLAVLPDVLARQHPAKLRALTAVPIPDIPVYAIRRRPLGESDRMDRVVEILLEIDLGLG